MTIQVVFAKKYTVQETSFTFPLVSVSLWWAPPPKTQWNSLSATT